MIEPIILDASAWLAVLLQEEDSPALQPILEEKTLLAPELIKYETANGIVLAKKRKRLSKSAALESYLQIIQEFPVKIVNISDWWPEATRLLRRHDITFYDAAYIGSAKALGAPMLSLDKEILAVMKKEKVTLVN